MYPDGVCRVTDNYYTKTVQFQDINYQLNQNEDKTAIFDGWCDFLNYFDSSIRFQLSFINLSATRDMGTCQQNSYEAVRHSVSRQKYTISPCCRHPCFRAALSV